MRRILLTFVVALLVALSTQVALAEPKVSGLFYHTVTYELGATSPYTFASSSFLRLNVSGNVSDNLSYFGRVQGNQNSGANVVRANATYKNVIPGLSVTLGREFVDWDRLNYFNGSGFDYKSVDGLVFNYSAGSASINAYYQVNNSATAKKLFSDERVAARLTTKLGAGGLSLDVAGKADMLLATGGGFGYGVSGQANVPGLGSVYAEVGENPNNTNASGMDYIIAGANIDLLKSVGVGAWVEYSVTKQAYAFQLSRGVAQGVTLYFGGNNDNAQKDLKLSVTAEFAISF